MSELEQVWRERIEWQQQSGITVAECCEAEGVSAASFYRWKKLLTAPQRVVTDQRPRPKPQQIAAWVSGSIERSSGFVPITVREPSANSGPVHGSASDNRSSVRIELPNGVVIHVAADLDGQRLGDVIIAVGQIHSVLPGVTVPGVTGHGLLQHGESSC